MTTLEKIEIREIFEFQLYERGWNGSAKPIGEVRRMLDPSVHFDGEAYDIKPGKWYAMKRRKVTIDADGFGHPGDWSGLTEWKRATAPDTDD